MQASLPDELNHHARMSEHIDRELEYLGNLDIEIDLKLFLERVIRLLRDAQQSNHVIAAELMLYLNVFLECYWHIRADIRSQKRFENA